MKPYKKLKFWIVIVAIMVCAGLAIGFLLNSKEKPSEKENEIVHSQDTDKDDVKEEVTPTATPNLQDTLPENTMVQSVLTKNAYGNQVYGLVGDEFARRDIISITFLDTLEHVPENHWDVSLKKNGKVLAWTEENGEFLDLYIAGEGGVYAKDCQYLFSGYVNVKSIHFNDCFFTEYAKSMSGMFGYCNNLTVLDLSGLDTSNVTSMMEMFLSCEKLQEVVWGEKNTEKLTNMSRMFYECGDLKKMDLSEFDTQDVIYMMEMFRKCSELKEVNLSGLDARNVYDISYMFAECSVLTELYFDGFSVKDVKDWEGIFDWANQLDSEVKDRFNKILILGDSSWHGIVDGEEQDNEIAIENSYVTVETAWIDTPVATHPFFKMALSGGKPAGNNTAIHKIENLDELIEFKYEFSELLNVDSDQRVPSFETISKDMDEAYFEKYTLFVLYLNSNSSSWEYDIRKIEISEGVLEVHVEPVNGPLTLEEAEVGRMMIVPIAKDKLRDVQSYKGYFYKKHYYHGTITEIGKNYIGIDSIRTKNLFPEDVDLKVGDEITVVYDGEIVGDDLKRFSGEVYEMFFADENGEDIFEE